MKLVNKKKKVETTASKLSDFAKSKDSSSGSTSWMTKGRDVAALAHKTKLAARKSFAPEVYIKDGESKQLRFRSSEPAAGFFQYNLKKNGRWNRYTAPGSGEVDLFKREGLRASFKSLYEVIDVDGFKDKQGKQFRNVPRFFLANVRVFEQLEALRKKKGDLTSYNIEISRQGADTQTVYTIIPEDREEFAGIDKIPTIKGDIGKYYTPPTLEEQRAIIGSTDEEEAE